LTFLLYHSNSIGMAIIIKKLTKVYSNGHKALDDVSFEIKSNQIFGLLGANGAGKTTLLNILSGLVTKTSGTIEVDGLSLDNDLRAIKEKFGIVPQEFNFNIFETCEDIVYNQAGLYGIARHEIVERLAYLFENLGLASKAKEPSKNLSGGMKRRLMIARALIHRPQILILDEPTAGVDVELRKDMWLFLEKLQKEESITVILTTHYLEEVERLCTDMVILDLGKLQLEGQVKDLISQLPKDNYVITTKNSIELKNIELDLNLGSQPNSYSLSLRTGETLNQCFDIFIKNNIDVISITPESSPVEQLFLQTIHKANKTLTNLNYDN
jgi:ABC-2 type transport system ATP-binding protein